MAPRDATSGVLFGLLALGLALGCAGASFESGGKGGSGGVAAEGGTSGTSGKGGTSGKAGGSKGGSGGDTSQTGGSGGTSGGSGGGSGSGAQGGKGGAGGSSGSSGTGADGGTAGSSASGGTGGTANGGTAGTAGSFPCVTGGECANDGDSCSEAGCCPPRHTCEGGVWGPGAPPPCAAPLCPFERPADGTACSVCSVPSDGCTWDECPFDGPLYTGACVDDHWQITADESCTNGACCTGNGDCEDHHCVSRVCKSDDPRGCWDDDQCASEEVCSGVWVCPCSADCDGFDEPGTCVPKDSECCVDDVDCKDSETCLRGVCKLPDPAGGCWSDRDCIGGSCEGESLCACNESCLVADHPGMCVDSVPLPF